MLEVRPDKMKSVARSEVSLRACVDGVAMSGAAIGRTLANVEREVFLVDERNHSTDLGSSRCTKSPAAAEGRAISSPS